MLLLLLTGALTFNRFLLFTSQKLSSIDMVYYRALLLPQISTESLHDSLETGFSRLSEHMAREHIFWEVPPGNSYSALFCLLQDVNLSALSVDNATVADIAQKRATDRVDQARRSQVSSIESGLAKLQDFKHECMSCGMEFDNASSAATHEATCSRQTKVRALFHAFDYNSNGTINVAEFARIGEAVCGQHQWLYPNEHTPMNIGVNEFIAFFEHNLLDFGNENFTMMMDAFMTIAIDGYRQHHGVWGTKEAHLAKKPSQPVPRSSEWMLVDELKEIRRTDTTNAMKQNSAISNPTPNHLVSRPFALEEARWGSPNAGEQF